MNIIKFNAKTLFTSVALATSFSILMSLACFDARCDNIRQSVLRLHILANSDSEHDQQIKLTVRDAVLEECGHLFSGIVSTEQAINEAKANIPRLTETAKRVLDNMGCSYGVSVEIAPTDFNTRQYDDVTLPAGRYMAVRILLGDAEGKNWWCVCFPNMCLPAASEREEIGSVLDDEDTKIVTKSDGFKVKFKIVELYEDIKNWLS